MKVKVKVRWLTRSEPTIQRIRERFGMPRYTTLNGWTPAEIAEADMELLQETARRGFIYVEPADWRFNGQTYSWQASGPVRGNAPQSGGKR